MRKAVPFGQNRTAEIFANKFFEKFFEGGAGETFFPKKFPPLSFLTS